MSKNDQLKEQIEKYLKNWAYEPATPDNLEKISNGVSEIGKEIYKDEKGYSVEVGVRSKNNDLVVRASVIKELAEYPVLKCSMTFTLCSKTEVYLG